MTTRADARRLIVLRHGETTFNAEGRWQGQYDAPLSERGRAQAAAAAAVLAAYSPTVIWSSDLSRAADTARAVAEVVGRDVTYDARLRELDVGTWSGRTGAEVRAADGELLARLNAGEDLRRGTTGETVADVVARARPAADELLGGLGEGETAVIATHGITGRALVASLVDLDQHTAWSVLSALGNCAWAELGTTGDRSTSVFGDIWRIERWNVER